MSNVKRELIWAIQESNAFEPCFKKVATKIICELGDELGKTSNGKINLAKGYVSSIQKHATKRGNSIRKKQMEAILWVLNKYRKNNVGESLSQEVMTDHCFLRYLSRGLGYNVGKAKEKALQNIKEDDKEHLILYRDGIAITFLPQ